MSTALPLRGEQIQAELFGLLPEIEVRFRKQFEGLYDFATETPGEYLLFEDIVFPYIREIGGDVSKREILRELFDFLERMADSGDPPVLDLLGIAITENLVCHPELLREVEPFVGPNTKQMIDRDLNLFLRLKATRT